MPLAFRLPSHAPTFYLHAPVLLVSVSVDPFRNRSWIVWYSTTSLSKFQKIIRDLQKKTQFIITYFLFTAHWLLIFFNDD
jgi:hypothetical protein